MADERIDIEVTDKVDDNIEKKILGIATSADKGATSVQKLKNQLKDINVTAVSKLAAASASATNALARELNATAKLTIAKAREAEATGRMALQAQKLATEQAKTTRATIAAQMAADKAAAAKAKEATASAILTKELEREANAKKRIIHDPVVIQPASGPITPTGSTSKADFAQQTNAMRRTSAPIIAPAEVDTMNKGTDAANKLNQGLKNAGAGAGLARHNMVNLGYQLQDIVVSLQAGQAPLTVFIQQGSQIAGIAASAGVGLGTMARAVWALLAPFAPIAIALAALYFGFKQFTNDMATTHKKELQDYSKTLGLTSKEMRKLGNDSVDASGKLKSFNNVTITMGDSWNGFKQTVAEGWKDLIAPFEGTSSYFKDAWGVVMGAMRYLFLAFYGVVVGGMKGLARIVMNLPAVIANTVKSIVNQALDDLEFLVNGASTLLNKVIDGVNPILAKVGTSIDHVGTVSFGRLKKSGSDAFETIGDAVFESMGDADKTLSGFAARWDKNSTDAAKKRIRDAANAIIANRNPKKDKKEPVDHTAENRAHALDMVNLKLDDELKRMKLLKPERDVQQRYDQIEAELAQKKIKLNDTEKASIMGKVRAIEAYKFVQAESDRIYEDSVGPLRTLNASIDAAADLYSEGKISLEAYNAELGKSKNAFEEATDPLNGMKQSLESAERATGKYGDEVARSSYLEEIRQTLHNKGIPLYDIATGKINAEAAALMKKNDALMQQQYIQSQVGEIVNPMLEDQKLLDNKMALYAELDRLEANSVLTHEQHERAKHALDAKFTELRLSNMSNTFGELAKLSSSGNAELAAIGKAAAVAQATMDGYVAVQKALASGPPPWNYIQAAAVAVSTGAQVAGILSTNVGSFATGGQFMVDGRAGVDANNINMNVTRGERVSIETPAQQKANDAALGGGMSDVALKVVNVTDPNDYIAAMNTPDGERVVLNILRRNPGAVKALMGSGTRA